VYIRRVPVDARGGPPAAEVQRMRRQQAPDRGARARRGVTLVLACTALLLGLAEPLAAAQAAPADTLRSTPPALRTRIYLGMWSTHLRDLDRGLNDNALIGLAWRGYYAATFINSFGDRSVAAGIQRSFTRPQSRFATGAIGYRAGVLTGYDERFFGIGHISPVLPFAQLLGSLDVRNVGFELAYGGIVASLITSVRF
jgi:hypothetical protein